MIVGDSRKIVSARTDAGTRKDADRLKANKSVSEPSLANTRSIGTGIAAGLDADSFYLTPPTHVPLTHAHSLIFSPSYVTHSTRKLSPFSSVFVYYIWWW